jgi:hypothetical protein
VLATALAALPMLLRAEEMKAEGLDARSLEEVRWLSEEPNALSAALGRPQVAAATPATALR